MAKMIKAPDSSTVLNCEYCPNVSFKRAQEFIRHLKEEHCSREGGSYVCHYGYNNVCCSLPCEGVSDKDYIVHVSKHAIMQQEKRNNSDNIKPEAWNVYSACSNLPAVLNDPKKGKQNNFLTKTWGDNFIDKVDVPKSPYLIDITMKNFDNYLRKIGNKYKRKLSLTVSNDKHNAIINNINNNISKNSIDIQLNDIPNIFLNSNLNLCNKDTFECIFPFIKNGLLNNSSVNSSKDSNIFSNVKYYQEKLSHYLDIIEIKIAEQVSSKSQVFFNAMTSHDVLMEQLKQTIVIVKLLRNNINNINNNNVIKSLNIIKLERNKLNSLLVYEKLKLMSTVHQSQPMIQLLLSTPDYVAALDLISTTQEILYQELNGIHSFRHLSSQLTEMEHLVDKMLFTEFQRYATADLNRPLSAVNTVLDSDKLVSIISGLLRQKHFQFIDVYKEETVTTIKTITKQIMIEVLAESDCCSDQQAAALELQSLSLSERLTLLQNTIESLTHLLFRVKSVYDLMKDTIHLSSDQQYQSNIHHSIIDRLLTVDEHSRVINKLNDMLISVCDYCHEKLAGLLSTGTNSNSSSSCSSSISSNNSSFSDKHSEMNDGNLSKEAGDKHSWLSDKATASQVCQLASMVEGFTETCEKICGKQSTALRSAFKAQASKFAQRFHSERKNKLTHLLEAERWKQSDVPPEFQSLVTYVARNQRFPAEWSYEDPKHSFGNKNFILINEEKFAVVNTALMLLQMIHEYCRIANEIKVLSGTLGRQLAELLRHYNSRCCQLVLGAGAMQVAGLKTITSTILVLAGRSLKLILWFMPFVKAHFQDLVTKNGGNHGALGMTGGVTLLDSVERDVRAHVREIDGKILTIVDNLVGGQISVWDAKPPVPSQSFRNISKHLIKLHEAVSGILPPVEVQALYRTVNLSFKEKLREQLLKMNIINNGGPQHGVVTSELTFYLEALRNLKVLPPGELSDDWTRDIWSR